MHPELYITAYRQQRSELDRELGRRWAVQQRAPRAPRAPLAPGATPARASAGRVSVRTQRVADAVAGRIARVRGAVRGASSAAPCCAAA